MDRILTVSAAASARDLVALDVVQSELNVSASTYNARLAAQIARASRAVERHCNRVFAKQTYVETLRLDRAMPRLSLSQWPLISLTSIVEDGVTLATTEREYDAEHGILYRLDGADSRIDWPATVKIVVTYVAGYLVPTQTAPGDALPADIAAAAIEVVKDMHFGAEHEPRLRSETWEGLGSASYLDPRAGDGALPATAAALLANYARFGT
jgi:hypothetical protein